MISEKIEQHMVYDKKKLVSGTSKDFMYRNLLLACSL